ncbi:hypothetical protein [Muricoccus radiodurans]|uniref:hypothetical protein n=1 Tax=Muricoccus radiodurans TaxID=2231721 RepID=UPI003CFB8659
MLDFLKLRPSAPTAAAIAEAAERAQVAHADAQHRLEAARQQRDALLLDGEPAALTAAEKALTVAREDVERAEAIVAQLETRRAAATRSEAIGRVTAAGDARITADAELRRWWEKNAPGLRRILQEGHRLSTAAQAAADHLNNRKMHLGHEYPDAELPDFRIDFGEHNEWHETVAKLIQHGVSAPRPTPQLGEPVADEPERPNTGPGTAVIGVPVSRNAGTLAMTYPA